MNFFYEGSGLAFVAGRRGRVTHLLGLLGLPSIDVFANQIKIFFVEPGFFLPLAPPLALALLALDIRILDLFLFLVFVDNESLSNLNSRCVR